MTKKFMYLFLLKSLLNCFPSFYSMQLTIVISRKRVWIQQLSWTIKDGWKIIRIPLIPFLDCLLTEPILMKYCPGRSRLIWSFSYITVPSLRHVSSWCWNASLWRTAASRTPSCRTSLFQLDSQSTPHPRTWRVSSLFQPTRLRKHDAIDSRGGRSVRIRLKPCRARR